MPLLPGYMCATNSKVMIYYSENVRFFAEYIKHTHEFRLPCKNQQRIVGTFFLHQLKNAQETGFLRDLQGFL